MDLGGAETFAMHIYRSIDRNRIQFDFAVSAEKSCYYDDEIQDLGGRIIRHTAPSKAGFRGYGKELRAILRRFGPFCAVHSHLHSFSGYVLGIAAHEGVPVRIAHMHSTRDGRSGTLSGFAYHAVMRCLIRRFATHVFGCSRAVLAAAFGERWPAESRMSVLHNGIDFAPYALLRGGQAELRRRLSLPTTGSILGHIGNFTAAKNHAFLIEVFRQYRARDPGATLILVGDGTLRPQLERQIEACSLNSHVRLLGRRSQSDIPDILAAFDALVMPSLHEGLPVSLIEAQAAGVPCVVSSAITDEADLGLGLIQFVGLADGCEPWANAIGTALTTNRPNWAASCEALTSQGYDIRDTATVLTRIYQSRANPEPVRPDAAALLVG